MKKLNLGPLPTVIVIAILTSVVALALSVVSARIQEPNLQERSKAKNKTLPEIAAERDIELELREGPSTREYSDLRELAKNSDAIVLGTIVNEEAHFSGDYDITTVYKLDVDRIIKDGRPQAGELSQALNRNLPAPLSPTLTFTRFGGTVMVNGHQASIVAKGKVTISRGKTYVVFLEWTGGQYRLAGSMSGAVLVSDVNRVKSVSADPALRAKYDDLGLEEFLEKIVSKPY